MATTIAVLSQKGGTGKTTAVRTLADVFTRTGLEVLSVDLDPQGNLSDYFDVPPDADPTIADVLGGREKAADAIHGREALQQLRERFDDKVFDSVIRASIRYAESAERGVSILDYRPELGADYLALAEEVLERVGFHEERARVGELRAELVPA